MPKITKMNHIAIVVEDMDSALSFWKDVLGLSLAHIEDVPDQESEVAFMPLEGCEVELVKPTTEESGIARFLQKRGEGMHHLCFEVDDIKAMLVLLKNKNVKLIHEEPQMGSDGRKFAFIHPKSANGVLVELYELE
jgi:methylmalonyl-CoA/ethylmalonyl-CoA epimerase